MIVALVAWAGMNQFYGWKRTFTPLSDFQFVSDSLKGATGISVGNRFSATPTARIPVPFPSDFVTGIDIQKRDFEWGLESYLRGEIRHGGWWYYYLYALAIKTPIATLALTALATLVFLGERIARGRKIQIAASLLLVPVAVVAFVSAQTGFNHHLRYVLPAVPFLFVWASQIATWRMHSRLVQFLFALLPLLLAATESLSVYPHSLSFFNLLVGGPPRGHLHLLDSNIDWGQDLLYLKDWCDRHPEAKPLYLATFSTFDPALLGIKFDAPPSRKDLARDRNDHVRPPDGSYVISVNRLHGLRRVLMADGQKDWISPGDYTYFQDYAPCDRIGYSLLVYRFSSQVTGPSTVSQMNGHAADDPISSPQ